MIISKQTKNEFVINLFLTLEKRFILNENKLFEIKK